MPLPKVNLEPDFDILRISHTKFYVKDLSFKYKVYISKKIEQTLRKKKLIKQTSIKGININIINLYETYKILKTDLKTKNQYFLKKH